MKLLKADLVLVFQSHGELVVLRYASRWGKEMLRKYLNVSPDNPGRHMLSSICPCQFIENHLKCKPKGLCSSSSFMMFMFHSIYFFSRKLLLVLSSVLRTQLYVSLLITAIVELMNDKKLFSSHFLFRSFKFLKNFQIVFDLIKKN